MIPRRSSARLLLFACLLFGGSLSASGQMRDIADVVAYLLLEQCFETETPVIGCPTHADFEQLQTAARQDENYSEAIDDYLQARTIEEHINLISDKLLQREKPGSSMQNSLPQSAAPSTLSVASPPMVFVENDFYAIDFLLAGAIRGINGLNLGPSTLQNLRVTKQTLRLLAGFRLENQTLFESMVNRARVAKEVWGKGADPVFLLDRTSWLYHGEMVTWDPGDQNLIDAYFSLLKLQSFDGAGY